jgi:hypothetical protein
MHAFILRAFAVKRKFLYFSVSMETYYLETDLEKIKTLSILRED